MNYINRKTGREVETVDSEPCRKEARRLASEYRLADPAAEYYVSSRADRETREADARAARAELDEGHVARGLRFVAELSAYSLESGNVGRPVGVPLILSRHKSRRAAGRVIGSAISGKLRPLASDYAYTLATSRRGGLSVALRYYVRDLVTGELFARTAAAGAT